VGLLLLQTETTRQAATPEDLALGAAMSRVEWALVSVVVGVLCPAALFFLAWWVTAALNIYNLAPIPEPAIAVAAFIGLGTGLILDLLFLRDWVSSFYVWDYRLLGLAYLFGSAVAVALLMGLPFANIVWGALAGVYVGRRQHHAAASESVLQHAARKVGAFTALVTGLEALLIGLLALGEGIVVETIHAVTGLGPQAIAGPMGVGLVVLLCLLLVWMQMRCTKMAARIAYQLRL
jgi:hypothetical protein